MDEKQNVLSVLRALLVSNAKKGAMSLSELQRDYCLCEGKTKIPVFEYRNVGEFLHESGEFIMSVVNKVVLVEEKPRLESSHIKKLVTEQKSRHKSATTSINLPEQRMNSSRNVFPDVEHFRKKPLVAVTVPVHAEKPSSIFTFEEYEKLRENTDHVHGKWLENGYQEKPLSTKYQTISEDPSIREKNVSEQSYVADRLKLLETILPFTVVNDNGKYDARICINHINHSGYGSNVDEAKSNAAINALKYLTKHKKNDNEFNSTDSLFSTKDDGLFVFVDDDYIPSMELDEKIYNAVGGVTLSSVENNVAGNVLSSTRVIDDLQISDERNILAQKMKTSKWKLIEIVNGIYKVTVKIDGIDYFGKGIDLSAAISDCAIKALNVERELGPHKPFNALNDMYKGLNYKLIDGDPTNDCKVMVQVDCVSYYGMGKTFQMAKDNAAEKCLKSICSGQRRKAIEYRTHLEKVTSNPSFKALKNMYPGLNYTLHLDENNNYTVKLMLDFRSYHGVRKTIEEATNDAVKKCLQCILNRLMIMFQGSNLEN